MLNREERRGLLWVILFGAVLGVAVILLLLQAGPGPVESKGDRVAGPPLAALEGRFVDAWSGEPLAPPQVSIPALTGISDHWLEEEDPLEVGRFRVGGIPAGGPYDVHFRVDGYEPWMRSVTLAAGDSLDLGDHPLRQLVSAAGWTVSGSGEPLADQEVEARDAAGGLLGQARSDSRGAYLLESLPEGVITLWSRGPEQAMVRPLTVDLRDARQRHERVLELRALRSVQGRLSIQGLPAQGQVQAAGRALDLAVDGSFLGAGLPADHRWLSFQEEAGETTLLPCRPRTLLEQDLPKRLRLELDEAPPPAARFPILVVARTLHRAEDGTILWVSHSTALWKADAPPTLWLRPGNDSQILWLGADGFCRVQAVHADDTRPALEWLAPRTPRILERPQGLRFAPLDGDHAALVRDGPQTHPDWDLPDASWVDWRVANRVPASLDWSPATTATIDETLRGRVVDGQDAPVAEARVSLFAWADREAVVLASCLTDSSGTFHLRRPLTGCQESLLVESHGQVRAALAWPGAQEDLILPVSTPSILRVRPEFPDLWTARVLAIQAILEAADPDLPWDSTAPELRGRIQALPQEDGTWLVPGLPPGPCRLQVLLNDGSTRSVLDLVGQEPSRAEVLPLPLAPGDPDDGP